MNGKVNLFANGQAMPLAKAPNSPPPYLGGYNAGFRRPEATVGVGIVLNIALIGTTTLAKVGASS